MQMPSRNYSLDKYRYGFNGKEKDKDINNLTAYDYGFRIYNPAIGKFLSVDPLSKNYPWYTPYQFAGNKPIKAIDLDGLEEVEIEGQIVTLTTGVYPRLQKQAFELANSNPGQLAAMQQEAWNKVVIEIDAIIPKYFDYKKNLQGVLMDQLIGEVENILLDSEAVWEFNSLYNFDDNNYRVINPLVTQTAKQLALDHYRASLNSNEFYEKYINSINKAKDANTKAALIEERSQKSLERIIAFQQICLFAAESFLEMYSYKNGSPRGPYTSSPQSNVFRISNANFENGLRFVRNKEGAVEDLKTTIDRIRSGVKFPHRNDGSVFKNNEGFLPKQPKGYYREYVHPTKGVAGPGRQRIVTGQGGEMYYSPTHYKSFIRIH